MKTVIQVWTHRCINIPDCFFWGLGDILRGTIQLYQFCKKNNYNFIVDIQLHNLSNHLVNHSHEFSQIIKNNKYNIQFVCMKEIEQYVGNNTNDVIYFFTNGCQNFSENLDIETKLFMRDLLTPNDATKDFIVNKSSTLPIINSVLHYRLGDEELILKSNSANMNSIVDHVMKNCEDHDILLSDSKKFKLMVREVNNCKNLIIFETEPKHIGFESSESLNDTLFEFFLMTKSKKIKTYSNYGWISGFVFWIHKIYDVPLIKM